MKYRAQLKIIKENLKMPNVIQILQQNIYRKRIVTSMLFNKPSPPKQVTEDKHS